MRNVFERLEKHIIVKNTLFIKKGVPRLPKNRNNIKLSFEGDDALADMVRSSRTIFRNFDSTTSVLIKINLNSSNPYPASTSGGMIDAVLHCLLDLGIKKICIGDSSGLIHLPTRKVINRKNFYRFKKYGVKIKVFDYGRWINIPVDSVYFRNIVLSQYIYEYDKIINLANLKSHSLARFSFSTKSLVGFMHPNQRHDLHKDHLEERIAELPLAIVPDINIIDARSAFVDGGPDIGTTAEAKTIIVSNSLLEADLIAYDVLFSLKRKFGIHDLDENPYSTKFFNHFMKVTGENH
jgi:uncharacterized protein (DUF362 family)